MTKPLTSNAVSADLPACDAPSTGLLPPELLPQVAAYFQVLSEPSRLAMLNLLRFQSASVSELAQRVGTSLANTSRHLSLMCQHGLVQRQAQGNSAIYSIADDTVYALCDVVCDGMAQRFERQADQTQNWRQALDRKKSHESSR